MYRCNNCGYIFDESEAEVEEYDMEDDVGVGGMFADHHFGQYDVCPDCYSSDIETYYEEDDEEDSE